MKTYILIVDSNSITRAELTQIGSKIYDSYEEFKQEVNPEEKGLSVYTLEEFIESCNDEAIWVEGSWIQQVQIQESQTVWLLEQYDQWFTKTSRILFGVFTSKNEALASLGYGTVEWEKNEFYQNGSNGDQWLSDILDCGYIVSKVEVNKFEEL